MGAEHHCKMLKSLFLVSALVAVALGTGPSACPQGDIECEATMEGSYCKYWQSPSVCQGSNLPCTCHPHNKCDAFCQWKIGPSSYCKYWQKGVGRVCQYSNIPCECD